jgi:beta-glucosidase
MLYYVLFLAAPAALAASPWPPSARASAEALVASMDLASILHLTSANQSHPYQGTVDALPQYSIPHLGNQDAPQGVAGGFTQVTALPSEMAVAMSFDPLLAYAYGKANGVEHRIKGANVMLGPAVNMARVPWCGRLFEYLGEDPTLAAAMAAQLVAGIQANNISGCVKHFILNVQETERHNVSSNVDRRTFMELYTPAFEAAIAAGVGSVMCSCKSPRTSLNNFKTCRSYLDVHYSPSADNRINGSTWACEDAAVQEDLLRGRWGFQGFVRSDGHALWETTAPANNGCDQEMPATIFFGRDALGAAIANGSVSEARVREMVTRQLTAYFALNLLSDPLTITDSAPASNVQRAQFAREVANAASVLLKNTPDAAGARLLPVDTTRVRSIAVFGDELTTEGGGSGHVIADYTVTPTQGIYAAVNGGLGPPVMPRPNNSCIIEPDTDYDNGGACVDGVASVTDCCNACTVDPNCVSFTFHANASCVGPPPGNRCWLHASLDSKRPLVGVTAGTCPPFPPPPPGPSGVLVNYGGADPTSAPALAAAADLAVVVVATTSSEGSDRPNLSLDAPFDDLATAVLAAQPNTVVVVRCPGPCLMPWLGAARAVFFQGLAGQEAGSSLADVLFGVTNPAGRLVHSFPKSEDDTWIQGAEQYPGTVRGGDEFATTDFSEKLEMGYRFYDAQSRAPLFEFGFGLSYTSFEYSALSVVASSPAPNASATVRVTVTNSGAAAGAEVAQLYVAYPAAAGEPPQLLRAFRRTWPLQPGESELVEWTLGVRAFSIFDVVSDDWAVVPGTYGLRVGASSRDIRLTTTIGL